MHLRIQGITIVPIESSKTTDLRYLSIKQRLRNSNSNFGYSCFLATKDVKNPALFIFWSSFLIYYYLTRRISTVPLM